MHDFKNTLKFSKMNAHSEKEIPLYESRYSRFYVLFWLVMALVFGVVIRDLYFSLWTGDRVPTSAKEAVFVVLFSAMFCVGFIGFVFKSIWSLRVRVETFSDRITLQFFSYKRIYFFSEYQFYVLKIYKGTRSLLFSTKDLGGKKFVIELNGLDFSAEILEHARKNCRPWTKRSWVYNEHS